MQELPGNHKRKLSKKMQRDELSLEDDLIKRKWIIYTGGKDKSENPLLTFQLPNALPGQFQKCWSPDDLIRLLCHMVDMVELMTSQKSVAFLLGLQNGCSDQKITLIIQAVQSLEMDRKGTVAVLYIVKPKISAKRKLLKKLLGIKRMKDAKSVSDFKTVLLSSISELHRYVDKTSLTEDLGGTIPYRHDAFIHLHSILPCVAVGEDVIDRLQDVRDKVHLLREYDLHDKSSKQLLLLRDELQERYVTLIRESDIVSAIERCKQALHTLELSSVDNKYDGLLPTLVSGVENHIRAIYTSLVQTHSELNGVWAMVEREVAEEVSLTRTNEEAEQICMDITEYFWPNMSQHPKVGENLYQAKTFRREFVINVYEPAKVLLEKATSILQKLQKNRREVMSGRPSMRDLVIRLSRCIHPFASRLNVINKSYASVYQHFLLYNKVAMWYNKTVTFLPASLFESCQQSQSTVSFITAPQGWRQITRKFLQDNPAPKEELLHSLDSCAETNLSSSRNTKLLVCRIRMLVTLMYETYLDKSIIRNVQRWKDEPLFQVTEIQYDDPLCSKVTRYSPSPNVTEGSTKLRRRISRTKSMKSKLANHESFRGREMHANVHRSMSNDTDHQTRGPYSKERFINLSDDNILRSISVPSCTRYDYYGIPYEDEILEESTAFSCDQVANNPGSILDYISYVTKSKGISSNKKLQYISDAISMLDLTSNDENGYDDNDTDLNHNYFYGDEWLRALSYDSISHSGTSADAVADMSDRLWKSVDDVSLNGRCAFNEKDRCAGSLNELSTHDKERSLWQEVENRQPTKTDSKASLGTCDADVSSRSNDEADDIDHTGPTLRRDRPSRQNIRRKRYTTDLTEVNIDEAMNRSRLSRRHSENLPSTNARETLNVYKKLGLLAFIKWKHKVSRLSFGKGFSNKNLYRKTKQTENGNDESHSVGSLPNEHVFQHTDTYSSSDVGYQSSPGDSKTNHRAANRAAIFFLDSQSSVEAEPSGFVS